jgi:hypothetical protein
VNENVQASGRAFLGLTRYVRDKYGSGAFAQAVAQMAPETQAVFSNRVARSSWYPYQAFAGFLEGLANVFGGGLASYCRELGTASGKRDINTIFRVYLAVSSPERLIRSCTKVWAGYYRNAGRMEAVSWEPSDTSLRISGFEGMTRYHCKLMEGWMIATMAELGAKVAADARETACCSRGDAFHEFRCSWAPIEKKMRGGRLVPAKTPRVEKDASPPHRLR